MDTVWRWTLVVTASLAAFGCGRWWGPDRSALLARRAALEEQSDSSRAADAESHAAAPTTLDQLRRIVAEVADLRGLDLDGPVAIELVEPRKYQKRVHGWTSFYMAYARQTPSEDQGLILSRTWALAESAAYYAPTTRSIHVRAEADAEAHELELVVAHEAEHALQHANFGERSEDLRQDAALANDALREGDAELTARLYVGARSGVSRARVLYELGDPDAFARYASLLDPKVARALFAYIAGRRFAAELMRAGGFGLLDRAFASAPASTEQILHPEKFLAGEQGAVVTPPSAPRGWQGQAQGVRGELEIQLMLMRCVPRDVAARAAAGWGGDAYLEAVGPRGKAMLWSTTWDTSDDAVDIERALRAHDCMPGATIVRRGARVAVVNGLPVGERARAIAGMLGARVVHAPAVRSKFAIKPRPRLPEREPGVVRGTEFVSKWLGVRGHAPAGAKIDGTSPDAVVPLELAVHTSRGSGMLFVWERPAIAGQDNALVRSLTKGYEGRGLEHESTVLIEGGLGHGRELVYRVGEDEIRIVLFPVCDGAGSLAFVRLSRGAEAAASIDAWIDSFHTLDRKPPLCGRLVPDPG